MAEDWRVDGAAGKELVRRLHVHEAELPQRVAVSYDDGHVFVYADTQDAAAAAARELQQLEPGTQWHVMRWHHEEEEWEDAGVPLPSTAEEHEREHERLEEQETAESQQTGIADWEIRVEFPSHHEAKAFAEQERDAGMAIAQRWKYVLIGFNDQFDAEDYGGRLRSRLPADAVMHVEPGEGTAWELMPGNPFAVFGGLGT